MNDRRSACDGRTYRIRLIDLLPAYTLRLRNLAAAAPSNSGRGDLRTSMVNRKGVFIGAYVPADLKNALQRRAVSEHRTLSQEITRILTEAVHGRSLPPGAIDRRTSGLGPRRRDSDPLPRRRSYDVPHSDAEKTTGTD